MPPIWGPGFMMLLRRLLVLIGLILVLVVYSITESVPYTVLAIFILLILIIGVFTAKLKLPK